jgi:REP element-mobilizing transposase RayT
MRHPIWNYQNSGYYFITINTKNREEYFGIIRENTMHLSNIGKIADEELNQTVRLRPYVAMDRYVIMPDHIHMILILDEDAAHRGGADHGGPTRGGVARYAATGRDGSGTSTAGATDGNMRNPYFSSISPEPQSISSIIRSYKSAVAKRCHENGHDDFAWQSRFHDRIIRDEEELYNVRKYVEENVMRWGMEER